MSLLAVLHFCSKDRHIAISALEASAKINGIVDGTILLAFPICDDNAMDVQEVSRIAFKRMELFPYSDWSGDKSWPTPQNYAWQQVARHIQQSDYRERGWLWWEADAVPIRPGWLKSLDSAYTKSRKLFAGAACESPDRSFYMNGVGIYPIKPVDHLAYCASLYVQKFPFDMVAGPEVAKSFANLDKLIIHDRKHKGGGKGRHFKSRDLDEFLVSRPDAVLYHGCTDGSLHNLISGKSNPILGGVEVEMEPDKIIEVPRGTKTFYHSGDIGDLIYSLSLIQHLGGGTLYLGPYIPNAYRKFKTRVPFDRTVFDWIYPLLKCQKYLTDIIYTNTDPKADYDLNRFRETWFDEGRKSSTLVDAYFERFRQGKFDHCTQWLQVSPYRLNTQVVIHRSSRYRNDSFPWREICGYYAGKMTFVGTWSEFKDFTNDFGQVCEFYQCIDALAMARIISGCDLFIGNQSFPNSLALGLRKPIIQEVCAGSPDCVLTRPENTYLTCHPIILEPLPKRIIRPVPDEDGIILIGPCSHAYGLGDTLTITPVAKQLGDKCRMQLPNSLAHLGTLFEGLCPVQLVEDFPVWPGNEKCEHQAVYKLKHMGLDACDHVPYIRLTENELEWGRRHLEAIKNGDNYRMDVAGNGLVAFAPTCAPWWSESKMRGIEYWEEFFEYDPRTILQFGRKDYPTIKRAIRMPFYNLRELASVYAAIGELVSVDTGDLHLMLAVGGKCFVVSPEENRNYKMKEWQYQSERIKYSTFDMGKHDYKKWRER